MALAAARAGEDHPFDIVGNCAKSDDSNESEIARFAVAFQPYPGAPITKGNLGCLGNADTGFHHPMLRLVSDRLPMFASEIPGEEPDVAPAGESAPIGLLAAPRWPDSMK